MDFLADIESSKYSILNDLYTMLPLSLFSANKSTRYILCGKFKKLERLIPSTNLQWWDIFWISVLRIESHLEVWEQ